MEGYSFSYYSPVDIVNMLNETDVFKAKPNISITRVAANEVGAVEEFFPGENVVNGINNYYNVSISRIATGETVASISGIETTKYDAGSTYTIEGISSYSAGGVDYTLASITVNGVGVGEETFNNILSADAISGVANDNIDIALYYTAVEAASAEASTEEAQ